MGDRSRAVGCLAASPSTFGEPNDVRLRATRGLTADRIENVFPAATTKEPVAITDTKILAGIYCFGLYE
jgi:hypothetical protein